MADRDTRRTNDSAHRLMALSRALGIERGFDLLTRIVYVSWRLHGTPQGEETWAKLVNAASADRPDEAEYTLARAMAEAGLDLGETRIRGTWAHGPGSPLLELLEVLNQQLLSVGDPGRSDFLAGLFEALLRIPSMSDSALLGEHGTPEAVADLMARLVGTPRSVLDPMSGLGNSLMAFLGQLPRPLLNGVEMNPDAATLSTMRFEMAGVEASIARGDFLSVMGEHLKRHDAVVLQPPWGTGLFMGGREPDWVTAGISSSPLTLTRALARSDLVWVELALQMLRPGGRAAVLLPQVTGQHAEEIRRLLALGVIEAVIALPARQFRHTSMPSALWLLQAPGTPRTDPRVLFVDTAPLVGAEGAEQVLGARTITETVDLVIGWRDTRTVRAPEYVAVSVHPEAVEERFGLHPPRYLSEAPTAEEVLPEPSSHLLSHLVVGGFKAFRDRVKVDLAPLTLVYGANSSGKSTLVQALLLLQQSVDSNALVTQGTSTNVGSFTGISHRHLGKPVELGLGFGAPTWELPPLGTPDPALCREILFRFGGGLGQGGELSAVTVRFGDNVLPWTFTEQPGHLSVALADASHVFEGIASGILLYPFDARKLHPDDSKDELRLERQRRTQGRSVVRSCDQAGVDAITVEWRGLFASGRPVAERGLAASLTPRAASVVKSYTDRLARLVAGTGEEAGTLLRNMTYLGPLRSAPQRFYDRATTGALPGDGHDIALYLFDNSTVAEQVNDWLAALEVPYTLDVVPVQAAGATDLVGDLVAMSLTDTRSGVTVSPADVGFGISQVLPIVVELTAKRDTIICVEQPETHLHPRLQARLADLFVAATAPSGRRNQLIVETHSEHIILRVQRRIREGQLSADQVAVLYVDQRPDGTAMVKRLRLDEDGDFLDEWPAGFFDERLDDLLGGLR